jgi:hypothetical protein
MNRILTLFLMGIAMLLSACGVPAGSDTQSIPVGAPPEEFPVKFTNVEDRRLSSLSIDLTGLASAPANKTYAIWMLLDGDQTLLLGPATAGETFTYVDPAGENLIGKGVGVWMSLESVANVQANTLARPTEKWYAGRIPESIVPLVSQLVVRAEDTPNGMPYDPGLKQQALLAADHGKLVLDAINANDLTTAQLQVEEVWNILSGQSAPEFGDLNGDGVTQNSGDGYGVWTYAEKVSEITDNIASISGLEEPVVIAAKNMGICVNNISETWGPQVREQGQIILDATDTASAQLAAQQMVQLLNALAKGIDANSNGTIDAVAGECGATQVYELSHGLFEIPMKRSQE